MEAAPSIATDSPCPVMTVDRNLTTPYVWNWTLNLQHAIHSESVAWKSRTSGITAQTSPAFVISTRRPWDRAGRRPRFRHALLPATPIQTIARPTAPAVRNRTGLSPTKFPYLANIFQMGNVYRSNYNGLQATLNARNIHGLSMVAGYTYAHASDDVGANWDFGYGAGLPQNSYNVGRGVCEQRLRYSPSPHLSLTYAIPARTAMDRCCRVGRSIPSPRWRARNIGARLTSALMPREPALCRSARRPTAPIRWSFYRAGTASLGNPSDFKARKGVMVNGTLGIPFYGAGDPICPQVRSICLGS